MHVVRCFYFLMFVFMDHVSELYDICNIIFIHWSLVTCTELDLFDQIFFIITPQTSLAWHKN